MIVLLYFEEVMPVTFRLRLAERRQICIVIEMAQSKEVLVERPIEHIALMRLQTF